MRLIARLKQDTQHLHQALENQLAIMQPEFQLLDYRQLLARFYGFYRPLESDLSGVANLAAALPDWPKRSKISWLANDLEFVGLAREQLAELPLCNHLPALTGVPDALGCLYVLEGSTLGGQIIGRHLHAKFNLGPIDGTAFISSYRDQVGPMWKTFGEALSSSAPEAHDQIVNAATQTFERMHEWLKSDPDAKHFELGAATMRKSAAPKNRRLERETTSFQESGQGAF